MQKKYRSLKRRNKKLRKKIEGLEKALKKERQKDERKVIRILKNKLREQGNFVENIRSQILSLVQGGFIPFETYRELFDPHSDIEI